eukprot:2813897-Rhodomonas_salina.2
MRKKEEWVDAMAVVLRGEGDCLRRDGVQEGRRLAVRAGGRVLYSFFCLARSPHTPPVSLNISSTLTSGNGPR